MVWPLGLVLNVRDSGDNVRYGVDIWCLQLSDEKASALWTCGSLLVEPKRFPPLGDNRACDWDPMWDFNFFFLVIVTQAIGIGPSQFHRSGVLGPGAR